jgi:hypothetical protein
MNLFVIKFNNFDQNFQQLFPSKLNFVNSLIIFKFHFISSSIEYLKPAHFHSNQLYNLN